VDAGAGRARYDRKSKGAQTSGKVASPRVSKMRNDEGEQQSSRSAEQQLNAIALLR